MESDSSLNDRQNICVELYHTRWLCWKILPLALRILLDEHQCLFHHCYDHSALRQPYTLHHRNATEGDVNTTSTTNVHSDGGKKNRKGKKHQKSHEEMLLDSTPREELISHPPSTTEASDEERGEEDIDVTAVEE
ncbi:hypothetical protein H5410_060509 [Solanum commersonii]|uniref:Uncharacterized protein n=1 Tax=Solanum commersonii TaxID=4109 RepID=A0A9J5W5U7_SOLCO|nr:hypothetical protein H5410_060509 [Solanum commersonii]